MRGGALGDFLVTLPALALIRQRHPSARITLAVSSPVVKLAAMSGVADRCVSLDAAWAGRLFGNTLQPDEATWLKGFSVVYSFVHDPDARVRTWFSANSAAGFRQTSPLVADRHAVDHFLEPLAGWLDIWPDHASRMYALTVPAPIRGELATRFPAVLASPPVWIHPGSGSVTKNWPCRHFIALARRIRAESGIPVLFCIGEADGALALELEQAGEGTYMLDNLNLPDLAGLLALGAGYVGNDSGVSHLAACVGANSVVVFGPSDERLWAPRGRQVRVVCAAARTAAALAALPVDAVFDAVRQSGMLTKRG